MPVTALYAALLALVFLCLSIRVIGLRRSLQVALGDAGNNTMVRAVRAHSNFAEYVPLVLLLIYFVEISLQQPLLVHGLGCSLLTGRLLHAFGVSQTREKFIYRVSGMALTFTVLAIASVCLLAAALVQSAG